MSKSITSNGEVIETEQLLAFPKPKKKEKKLYRRGPQFATLTDEQRRVKRQEFYDRQKLLKARRQERRKIHLDTHAPRWKKKAWAAFSRYIRIRDSLATTKTIDFCVCITCPDTRPFKQIQAGHFISGRNNQVLFDERQVNGQCYVCNMRKKGNWAEYYKVMVKRHGEEEVKKMIYESSQVKLYNVSDYKDIVERYENRVLKLLGQL